MSESLYRDTGTPAPNAVPSSEGDVLLNEIAVLHATLAQLRQIMASGLMALSQRVVAVEEREAEDRLERAQRQTHLDRLLWAGLALAAAHLVMDAIRILGRSHG